MSESWFEEFGKVLDTLYHIMRNAEDDEATLIQEPYQQLDAIYYDIKDRYGYKDSSDEEF